MNSLFLDIFLNQYNIIVVIEIVVLAVVIVETVLLAIVFFIYLFYEFNSFYFPDYILQYIYLATFLL